MADIPSLNDSILNTVLRPYMPVFYVSFIVTLVLTPLMRKLAQRHGIVDNPDGKRKVHVEPIAYLGGVATFLGWLAGVMVSVMVRPHNAPMTFVHAVQVPPGVLLGAAIVVLFGLMDDVYHLAPITKLIGQALAAVVLFGFGRGEESTWSWGVGHDLAKMFLAPLWNHDIIPRPEALTSVYGLLIPFLSMGLVIFLIVATCNATNLLDGLDGLCSGVTGIMSLGYLLLAVHLASRVITTDEVNAVDPMRITLSLALLGAVLGFLPYNFNPANIFMGDTGSMFMGYICGTMMILFGREASVQWFMGSVVIFGLPMLDTLLAIVRRKLNGQRIFSPDSNHIHHFLIRRGYSVRKAVLICYAMAAMFVSFALVLVVMPTRLALGLYLVLFGWLVVAAFKIGVIFKVPVVPANQVLQSITVPLDKSTRTKPITPTPPPAPVEAH